ncbi:MAG: hypothetical protein AAF702_42425 [Chloroflexota bacterium]
MALLRFFATDLGVLSIGFLAILMILAWDWRVSLFGMVLIQVGVAGLATFREGIEIQWTMVQTLTIVLCVLILALSATQVSASPTSRQAGNGLLRLMIVILFYVSWRLFQFDVPIPVIDADLSLLFTWLSLCALLMLAMSDNPLFTGCALLLWFIPMHVVISVLFPVTNLIVLYGVLELTLALCCSYLILAERIGVQGDEVIMTDLTFPLEDDARLLPSFDGMTSNGLGHSIGENTRADLRAVLGPTSSRPESLPSLELTEEHPVASSSYNLSEQPTTERTGEHPIIASLARGKRTRRAIPPPTRDEE